MVTQPVNLDFSALPESTKRMLASHLADNGLGILIEGIRRSDLGMVKLALGPLRVGANSVIPVTAQDCPDMPIGLRLHRHCDYRYASYVDYPLNMALRMREVNYKIILALAEAGASFGNSSTQYLTPMHIVASRGDSELLKFYLGLGGNINRSGRHLVMEQGRSNHRVFAQHSAVVEIDNVLSIHCAMMTDNIFFVEEVVKAGANVNAIATIRRTPQSGLTVPAPVTELYSPLMLASMWSPRLLAAKPTNRFVRTERSIVDTIDLLLRHGSTIRNADIVHYQTRGERGEVQETSQRLKQKAESDILRAQLSVEILQLQEKKKRSRTDDARLEELQDTLNWEDQNQPYLLGGAQADKLIDHEALTFLHRQTGVRGRKPMRQLQVRMRHIAKLAKARFPR